MVLNIQDDIQKLQFMGLLDALLTDKTTGQNIIWGTDTYRDYGVGYGCRDSIRPELIAGMNANVIKTRARKAMEQQSERTRQHAEVFSPFWICKKMCDYADEIWTGKDWTDYVDSRRMEITCGEAPYLVSRYDVETGEAIPIRDRIGLLDRKLRKVNENAQTEEEWLKWAFRAFRATYGYDYQGDNVLIARVNLLMTFEENLLGRWKRKPTIAEYRKMITVIVWNLWQMDGLTGATPYGIAEDECQVIDWFGMFGGTNIEENKQPRCRVYNWTGGGSVEFLDLPTRGKRAMKFDFIIGNPPYQEEMEGTSDKPIYNAFMSSVYGIATRVELITPGRFLFNAGKTPKAWNQAMLSDPHLKVLYYEQDSSKVFMNTDIKGGVVITYRDASVEYGAITVFTPYAELNSILHKVLDRGFSSLNELIYAPESYRINRKLHIDFPEAAGQLSNGHMFDFTTNIFERLPQVFFAENPNDGKQYVGFIGRESNQRVIKWIRRDYVEHHANLDLFKVIIPKANGSGTLGEELSGPMVGKPGIGHNQTFISIGTFETQLEAEACLKYVKSKFARTMLGTLKVTQDNKKSAWANVPLQDFTAASDIDWSKSIPEIDQQLYAKYKLDNGEIAFIESHAKEME